MLRHYAPIVGIARWIYDWIEDCDMSCGIAIDRSITARMEILEELARLGIEKLGGQKQVNKALWFGARYEPGESVIESWGS